MDNSKIEIEFLSKMKNAIEINNVNETKEDITNIIKNLEYLLEQDRKGGPDYAYKKYYFEKFCIDSSPKRKNKNNKIYSRKKVIDNKIENESKYESKLFETLSFEGQEIRTNIKYMRQNLKDMIKLKLEKQSQYKINYPQGEIFGFIIYVEDLCEIYTNDKGEYFSDIRDTNDLTLKKYEIYKDYNLIKEIKKIYADKVSLLIFVETSSFNKVVINYINLSNEIKKQEMKTYPDKILQVCSGSIKVLTTKPVDNTNIQYTCQQSTKINSKEIKINNLTLKRDYEPNVYVDNKGLLFYETTQHMIALNPEISEEDFLEYLDILLNQQIILNIEDEKYTLTRISPLNSYMHISFLNGKGEYKMSSSKILKFNFK